MVILGLVLLLRDERLAGLLTAVAGAGWFLIATELIIPLAGGGSGPYYQQFFSGFGDSLGAVAGNLLLHPGRILEVATQPDRLTYYRQSAHPVAFVPLAAPLVLAIGAPQTAVNVLSTTHPPTHDARFQYTAVVLAAVFLATIGGVALLGRAQGGKRFLVGRSAPPPRWCRTSPTGCAATSFRTRGWPPTGVSTENLPDPTTVDYLVVDTTALGEQRELFERLTGPGKEFQVVHSRDGIVTAQRLRAPG